MGQWMLSSFKISDILKWLVHVLLSPILFPLYFVIGFIKDYFLMAFSSPRVFIATTLLFPVVVPFVAIGIFISLLRRYFSLEFKLSVFLGECGGYRKRIACAWCGRALPGHYYSTFMGECFDVRYCSRQCLGRNLFENPLEADRQQKRSSVSDFFRYYWDKIAKP